MASIDGAAGVLAEYSRLDEVVRLFTTVLVFMFVNQTILTFVTFSKLTLFMPFAVHSSSNR